MRVGIVREEKKSKRWRRGFCGWSQGCIAGVQDTFCAVGRKSEMLWYDITDWSARRDILYSLLAIAM